MENNEQKRIEQITGDEFREMAQSDEAFRLGSDSRFTHYMNNASIRGEGKDPNEVIPISIPSLKYRSNHWRTSVNHLSTQMTRPSYEVSEKAALGGTHNDIKFFYCDVHISDCVFLDKAVDGPFPEVRLEYLSSNHCIKFDNCVFESHFSLNNVTGKCIEFSNCQFNYRFSEFFDSTIEKIIISNCSFKELNISSSKSKEFTHIELKNTTCSGLNLNGDYFGDIILNNLISPSIKFEETYYDFKTQKHIPREKIFIRGLHLIVSETNENSYELKKIKSDYIRLSGHLNKKSVLFRDIETNNFEIENFINEGQLRLHSVEILPNGAGKIIDSQLGKTEFNNVNFRPATSFQIYFSNLTEIITTDTHFPEHINARNEADHQEVREIYRQLKYAASKQGDRIRELKYEQFEFIAHEKSLKGLRQLGNRIILATNRITNNHGQDWFLAFFLLILFTLILFISIKISLDYIIVFTGYPSALDTSQYLNFALNPLHDFNKIFNIKEVEDGSLGQPKLIDALGKIISGYLIFQFLRAFRKYVR